MTTERSARHSTYCKRVPNRNHAPSALKRGPTGFPSTLSLCFVPAPRGSRVRCCCVCVSSTIGHPLVGPGLVLWHPRGTMLTSIVTDYWKEEHRKAVRIRHSLSIRAC